MRLVVGGRWRFGLSLAAFALFNAAAAIYAVRYYNDLLAYCEGPNRARGQAGLDCLEHYQWWWIYLLCAVWIAGAVALAAVSRAAFRSRPG